MCEEWLNKWPDYSVKSCGRTFSDHCPIFINSVAKDWRPKPFKFFNCWVDHPNFEEFIRSKWQQYKVDGWAGFQLKEKMKLLKKDLQIWNTSVFGNKEIQIEEQKQEIEALDRLDDVFGLEEEEVINRNKIAAELMRNLIWRDNLLAQKAKTKWLNAGDVNSRFFHSWINKKLKFKGIEGFLINDLWVDSVEKVKEEAVKYFQNQFKARKSYRPQFPGDLFERKISEQQNNFLGEKFSETEITDAI